jgi:hypothetical protein
MIALKPPTVVVHTNELNTRLSAQEAAVYLPRQTVETQTGTVSVFLHREIGDSAEE